MQVLISKGLELVQVESGFLEKKFYFARTINFVFTKWGFVGASKFLVEISMHTYVKTQNLGLVAKYPK